MHAIIPAKVGVQDLFSTSQAEAEIQGSIHALQAEERPPVFRRADGGVRHLHPGSDGGCTPVRPELAGGWNGPGMRGVKLLLGYALPHINGAYFARVELERFCRPPRGKMNRDEHFLLFWRASNDSPA